MKAVVLGAGRIGCGLVGEALRASGYAVTFVTRRRVLADHLNRLGGYRIRLTDGKEKREFDVRGIRAVCAADTGMVVQQLAEAEIVATCVQPYDLLGLAVLVAAGLRRRSRPTNILTFQNVVHAGPAFRGLVASQLPAHWPLDMHGFSGGLAARVVSQRLGDPASDEPLTFIGDPPSGFAVDRGALRGPLPEIAGMAPTDRYDAAVRHKLYTFSAGHAVAAYLGFLKGYCYIHTAVRDPEVHSAVLGAMTEGLAGVANRHGVTSECLESDPRRIIARFGNAALDDPIVRVGRDSQRKLGPRDRLVGAATLAEEAGVRPDRLALAAAAALCFEDPQDPSSAALQSQLRRDGIEDVLRSVCRLDPSRGFGRSVAAHWSRISAGRTGGNLLLSLDRLLWAWSSTEDGHTSSSTRTP